MKETCSHLVIRVPVEAIIWMIGLLALALYDPAHQEHASLCIFNNIGFTYCPGCGLGRSISLLFHGDPVASFQAHPLGIIAVAILSHRIIHLWIEFFKRLTLKYD